MQNSWRRGEETHCPYCILSCRASCGCLTAAGCSGTCLATAVPVANFAAANSKVQDWAPLHSFNASNTFEQYIPFEKHILPPSVNMITLIACDAMAITFSFQIFFPQVAYHYHSSDTKMCWILSPVATPEHIRAQGSIRAQGNVLCWAS